MPKVTLHVSDGHAYQTEVTKHAADQLTSGWYTAMQTENAAGVFTINGNPTMYVAVAAIVAISVEE